MIFHVFKLAIAVSTLIGLTIIHVDAQGSCGQTFNESTGEITTPGFPNRLDFNKTCSFIVSVGDGRIKLTYENMSLPVGSEVSSLPELFKFVVGTDNLESRTIYSQSSNVLVILSVKSNDTNGYKGVKILYERISSDTCMYSHATDTSLRLFTSISTVNTTCEYFFKTNDDSHVVHISIAQLSLSPGSDVTYYDGMNDTVLARYNGTPTFIKTTASSSSSMRVVFRTYDNQSPTRRSYFIYYRAIPRGACLEEYYADYGRISSLDKPCVFIVRVPLKFFSMKFFIKFENLLIPPGDSILLTRRNIGRPNEISYLTPEASGRTHYIYTERAVEIKFNSSTKFDITFKDIGKDVCPYYFKTSDTEQKIRSYPGSHGNWITNNSCEYFIQADKSDKVVHISSRDLLLAPGDEITFYDGRDDVILAVYNSTPGLLKSVTSMSKSIRMVFRTSANQTLTSRRTFLLHYKEIPKGSCLHEYYGAIGSISSGNESCVFKIVRIPYSEIELKFLNLFIPANDRIDVFQKESSYATTKTTYLLPSDSGGYKYIVNYVEGDWFEIKFNSSAKFQVKFKALVKEYTVNLFGSNGTLESPHYPQTFPDGLTVTYYVQVPSGHVKLDFTELKFHGNEIMRIHDGNNTSAEVLQQYIRQMVKDLPVFYSSKNSLTILFVSLRQPHQGTYRFRTLFTQEPQVPSCSFLMWPHAHVSPNVTLAGRTARYRCDEDYIYDDDPYRNYLDRSCNSSGYWEPGKTINCVRRCAPLNESLKINSSLTWSYPTSTRLLREGSYAFFRCRDRNEELVGPNTITCTSYGNYSAPPPICKKRPPEDKDDSSGVKPWIIGASVGGISVIISIVLAVLRVCLGCFECIGSSSSSSAMELGQVNKIKP